MAKLTQLHAAKQSAEAEDLLTIEQAADRLNMSVRHVRRLVAERRIVFYRLGRSVRLKPADIAAYIEAGRVDPLTASDVWRDLRSVVA
jgi:excisionase family DNA binding protein